MWSYAASTSNLDGVRLLIGDVCSTRQLIQDEVIHQALDLTGNHRVRAAILVADSQAAQGVHTPTAIRVGDLSVSHQAVSAGWHKVAAGLRARLAYEATPFVGGIHVTDKQTRDDDTTEIQPFFTRTMMSHQENTSST